jgi:transcriptional regulator with XRE-family HTH domain
LALRAPKPKSPKYPKQLNTLGDHIRRRRLDLGLFQKQVAQQIGVSKATIWNWECHESSPQIHVLPQVIKFLGYDPFPPPESLAEKLVKRRKAFGVTQKEMAKRLGIDPTTLARLERGGSRRLFSKTLRKSRPSFRVTHTISPETMINGTRSLAGCMLF